MNLGVVFELDLLALILTPQWVLTQTLLVLTSQHSDVRLVIRGRDFLPQKLLDPPLVIVDDTERCLNNNPVTLVTDDTLRKIKLLVHFVLSWLAVMVGIAPNVRIVTGYAMLLLSYITELLFPILEWDCLFVNH